MYQLFIEDIKEMSFIIYLAVFIICFLPKFNLQSFEKSRSVWVEQGLIKGKIYKIDDQQLQIFRGIPYAEPPIGELRFKVSCLKKYNCNYPQKPVKKSKWEREFSASEYGPPCLQFMDFHKNDIFAAENMLKENEDCLFLNIFSPYVICLTEKGIIPQILIYFLGYKITIKP